MDRGHREGAQLARRRKRVRDRPPDLLADITAQRMREAERGVRFVAIHDHRDEQPIDRFPERGLAGQRGEGADQPRAVLGDITAVQAEALPADLRRGVRVAQHEGAFGAVGVFAEQAVEIIEDGQDEDGRRAHPCPSSRHAASRTYPRSIAVGSFGAGRDIQALSALSYTVGRRAPTASFRQPLLKSQRQH